MFSLIIFAAIGDVFLIGNSLTADTLPAQLDGNNGWHIQCGASLEEIYAFTEVPCVPTSTLWSDAFASQAWNTIVVQPYPASTIESNVGIITEWMDMQPAASFVIHEGWARRDLIESTYHRSSTPTMIHSSQWFTDLASAIEVARPGRLAGTTGTSSIMDAILHDTESGSSPYTSTDELYRDLRHMSYGDGRFMAHNAMRRAVGQQYVIEGFNVSPDRQAYLIRSIGVPEPSAWMLLAAVTVFALVPKATRRTTTSK